MSRPGDRTVEVELVEDDLDRSDRSTEHAPDPPVRRLPARAWALVVAVAVVAVGATEVTQRVRDAAVAERLADVPGLSVALDAPLREAWRVDGTSVVGTVDDVVLVRGSQAGDSSSAVDLSDGTLRHAQQGWCDLFGVDATPGTPGPGPGPRSAVTADDDGPALLMCTEHVDLVGRDGRSRGTVATVRDPVTGERRHQIDLGPDGSWSTIGSDVVSLGFDADDHVVAGRWSLATGVRDWAYRSPDPVPRNDSWGSSIDDELVRLEIGDWTLALDADTGERLAQRRPAPSSEGTWGPFALPGGGTAVTRVGDGTPETTVAGGDGAVRWTRPGLVAPPSVDDGSVPDVLLLVGADESRRAQRLEAVDAVTGSVRWVSQQRDGPTAVLQGLLLVPGPDGVTALDARTGATRWTALAGAPGDGATGASGRRSRTAEGGWGMVTDGRHVLTAERGETDWSLVARDVASGGTVWTSRSPVDAPELTLLPDGTVVVGGSGELVVLRP